MTLLRISAQNGAFICIPNYGHSESFRGFVAKFYGNMFYLPRCEQLAIQLGSVMIL